MTIWQKIWFWTKLALGATVVIHVVLFIVLNLQAVIEPDLRLIYTRYDRPRMLWVFMWTVILSIAGWALFRAVYKTLRQMQEAYDRQTKQRMQREIEDMQAKVSMLQTRADAPVDEPRA